MIWPIVYLIAVLAANYTATWFIPLPIFGMVAIGTLIFGITFTARDHVHQLGRLRVYTMIVFSAASSVALAFVGVTPWRVILASTVAIVLAETADTEIYQRLLSKPWLIRVSGSNLVSIPLDTLLFNLLAFGGVFPGVVLVSIIVGETAVKFLVGGGVALCRR